MASTVLSSSPGSMTGGSPVLRRRDSLNPSESGDRPRLSPTFARSYDQNDPTARERQRTMDEDMALQLSRARRETISAQSPYEHNHLPELGFPALPEDEPNELKTVDRADDVDDETLHPRLSNQVHASPPLGPRPDAEDIPLVLPTYQPNASFPNFDFAPMEEFAAQEKADLGLTSPTTRFDLSSSRPDQQQSDGTTEGEPSSSTPLPKIIRQRKLSHSNTPRPHRKFRGGNKIALFENHSAEPTPSFLAGRLGSFLPPQTSVTSFDRVRPETAVTIPGSAPGVHGILSTGHDRPYRFSFYSNALSATIHARSLGELPAEGQSFADLFAGVGSPGISPLVSRSNTAAGLPAFTEINKRPGTADAKKTTGALDGVNNTNDKLTNDDYDGSTWWLDITSPTDEEMKMLSKVFNIHPLTTEDIQMEETREKIELFRTYYLVCFRSFDQDPYSPTHLEPLNMYILVFRSGILSFHSRPTPHPQNVRRRIKQLRDYIAVTSDWISYALIDDITDAFGPLIQGIEYEVDSIDELVLILKDTIRESGAGSGSAEQSDMLRRIGRCRKKVMGLLRLIGTKADVVKGLAKRCNENWRVAPTSDIGLYLSDIQDHLITMTQNLNHYEKILSRSHSNYLAQISIEMTDANNQINDVLSKLTALGTVLIPMNLVTGLWGMNVRVPGQGVDNLKWFLSIIACLAAFAFIGGYSTYRFMVRR